MSPLIPCLLVLLLGLSHFCAAEVLPPVFGHAVFFWAPQTYMPTKSGNVWSPPHGDDQFGPPMPQPQIKLDAAQLQREAKELLDLSQSVQADIDAINKGLLPKDATEKLKRIQKLAKHLRGEIAP